MKHTIRFQFVVFASLLALGALTTAAQATIVLGQIDDFEDGSLMNWGGGANPVNIATGGPAGAGDNYIQITADRPSGPASRLAMFNDLQWSGDYITAGVTAIEMDVLNTSGQDVHMRLLSLFGGGGDYTSLNPVIVPDDGQWHHIVLGLLPGDLVSVGGFDYNATFSALPRLMLRHDADPASGAGQGDQINGVLGFDNITATPEPATLALLALGGLLFVRRR
jgi:hypothetical protein